MEQGRGSVDEFFGRHQVVGFDDLFYIVSVNSDRDTHEHVLRTFEHPVFVTEKIRTLKNFDRKAEREISRLPRRSKINGTD